MLGLINKSLSKKDFVLICGTDASLLLSARTELLQYHCENGADTEVFEQGFFEMSDILNAIGTISFLEEKRLVIIKITDAAKILPEDFTLLCSAIEDCSGAVIIITMYFPDKYSSEGKQAKALSEIFSKIGAVVNVSPLNGERLNRYIDELANRCGCTVDHEATLLLSQKYGNNLFLLQTEIEKAAALCGYSRISAQHIEQICTTVLSADIFTLLELLIFGNMKEFFFRLDILLFEGQEPIAILAAISSSFVDIYRVKCGEENHKNYTVVFTDFGYKGNNYRLKKAADIAKKISSAKLYKIINTLFLADSELKSTAAQREFVLYKHLFALHSTLR